MGKQLSINQEAEDTKELEQYAPALAKCTGKQRRFINLYHETLNKAQSVREAGFVTKYPTQLAETLLKKPHIKEAMAEHLKQLQIDHDLEMERIMVELRRAAFSDHRKLFNAEGDFKAPHELDDDTAAAIAESGVRTYANDDGKIVRREYYYKLQDKTAAQKALLDRFPKRVIVSGDQANPIQHQHNHFDWTSFKKEVVPALRDIEGDTE